MCNRDDTNLIPLPCTCRLGDELPIPRHDDGDGVDPETVQDLLYQERAALELPGALVRKYDLQSILWYYRSGVINNSRVTGRRGRTAQRQQERVAGDHALIIFPQSSPLYPPESPQEIWDILAPHPGNPCQEAHIYMGDPNTFYCNSQL